MEYLNQDEIPHLSKILNKQYHLFIIETNDLDDLQTHSRVKGFMIKTSNNDSLVKYQLLLKLRRNHVQQYFSILY